MDKHLTHHPDYASMAICAGLVAFCAFIWWMCPAALIIPVVIGALLWIA